MINTFISQILFEAEEELDAAKRYKENETLGDFIVQFYSLNIASKLISLIININYRNNLNIKLNENNKNKLEELKDKISKTSKVMTKKFDELSQCKI